MQKQVEEMLKQSAIQALKQYKPMCIGVTGTVGKTTTKEAIYSVLKEKENVRRNEKSFNNELGIPLTILGLPKPESKLGWVTTIAKAATIARGAAKDYPETLILEAGIDRPNDMDAITDYVPLTMAVVISAGSKYGSAHLEYFEDEAQLAKEKMKIVAALPKDGIAIVNKDNEATMKNMPKTKAKVLTFGFDQDADISADPNIKHTTIKGAKEIEGITIKVNYDGKHVPLYLPYIYARHHVYSVLAAVAVGVAKGMNLIEIATGLKEYRAFPGRLNIIKGLKNTWILDDSYNASPDAVIGALQTLKTLEGVKGQRIAVLGDMLELGEKTGAGHKKVAEYVVDIADELYTVGEKGKIIAQHAEKLGFPKEKIHIFQQSSSEIREQDIGRILQDNIKEGDVILVKGSQGARMEKIVKEIMAEPLRAEELLVRQEPSWLKR